MLAPLERAGLVRAWSDGEIEPGRAWSAEIEAAMAAAKVGVFLVSPHALASKFIMEVELPFFLKAAKEGRAILLWTPLSESLYERTPLRQIQALQDPSRPLDSLRKPVREKALKAICHAIERAAQQEPSAAPASPAGAPHLDLGRLPLPGPHFVGRDGAATRVRGGGEGCRAARRLGRVGEPRPRPYPNGKRPAAGL